MFKPFLTLFATLTLIVNGNADKLESSSLNIQSASLPQYENRIGFNFPLIGLSYERIKPNSYYIGIDGQLFYPTYNLDKIINFEARGGYHFFNKVHHHFIPTVGGGYLQIKGLFADFFSFGSPENKPEFAYTSLGFLYEHERQLCSMGINAQGLLSYRLPAEWNLSSENYGKITHAFPVFGFKGSISVTFRFSQNKNWDFQLEPFLLYLSSHKIKVEHAYKFFSFSEHTYEIKKCIQVGGLNLSIGRRF